MRKEIRLLLIKVVVLAVPLLILLIFYVFLDPFKVIYTYKSFYPSFANLNKDYVSTETFLRNYPNFKYDSFIFGNSRSMFYEVKDWRKHISSTDCYHFDASLETLSGIYSKLKFLDAHHVALRNVLIPLDYDTLYLTSDKKGHLFIRHPLVSGKNWYSFHLEFIEAFLDFKFLVACIDYSFSKKIKKYMIDEHLVDDRPVDYNVENNEIKFTDFENIIQKNSTEYYLSRKEVFFKRNTAQTYLPILIGNEQKRMLRGIASILTKNNTDYKIIINPLYDQRKITLLDLTYLREVFGRDRVFDFSGINEITKNIYNYYEPSHYRPHIARLILSEIYGKTTQND